ncbi:uncharacterized protein [Dysidea avara]|uniref:uncharacterized protein n=1 Tax=Dysidea avara TaxID=196820 RepID=UPI00332722E8
MDHRTNTGHRSERHCYYDQRNIRLDASFLKAECADYSGHYRESKINLNSYIANVDGQLKWAAGGNFFASSSNLRCVGASTLEATCRKINGQQIISRIDLNDAITNRNGHLLGLLPNVPGYYSATSIDISLRGTVLRAKCKTNKGDYHESTIDLNDYIANLNGCLEWGGQAFGGSSRNISLDGSSFLVAECVDKSGHYYRTSINLDHHIFNANGKLEMYIHRFVIKVDKHNAERVANVLQSYYDANKGNVRTQVADGDGVKYLYVSTHSGMDDGLIFQMSRGAEASIIHVASKQGKIDGVKLDILQAKKAGSIQQETAGALDTGILCTDI